MFRLKHIPAVRHTDEVATFKANVLAASGTIGLRTLQHLDKFVLDCKQAGIWDKLLEVIPLVGDQLAAACRKLKNSQGQSAVTANNFIESDYSEATGLTGNGSTKYLDLMYNMTSFPATGFLCAYMRADNDQAGNRALMGVLNAGATEQFWVGALNPAADRTGRLGLTVSATHAAAFTKGFYLVQRNSTTDIELHRNGGEIANQNTNTAHNPPALTLFGCAWNSNGTPGAYNNKPISFFAVGNAALTATESLTFYNIIQTLQTNLGRAI